jgi:hypothetical protein
MEGVGVSAPAQLDASVALRAGRSGEPFRLENGTSAPVRRALFYASAAAPAGAACQSASTSIGAAK